ncbi:sensor histidine kinase [Jatrophihabitans endophyticus]|uniref:sensor histidine kinase n=1 Tax=Jatrophihabitans endophyticus TaxID=1206085 RepID=UPI0019FB5780|nr:sensor histidine kinase [Jatrophihabitans endophyticus]MBE7189691.1 sensor domain-containing protein [Jatrophihabitans endophyticus]
MISEFARRVRLLAWAVVSIALGGVAIVLWILTVVSVLLFGVWLGIPLLMATAWLTARLADLHRAVFGRLLDRALPSPYLVPPSTRITARLATLLRDPATWRDLAWLLLHSTVGLVLAILGVVEGVLDVLFWWLPAGFCVRFSAWLGALLLGPTDTSRLAARVDQLAASRAETVDTQAAELRRIERDLHDGAQARLVALGMPLALAESQLDHDPSTTRALLGEAREASGLALAELRDLVRGIHPPVLADRGLGGAIQALALAAPNRVLAEVDVPARLPAPVESAAYFVTAEALTNAVRHSGAAHIRVRVRSDADVVVIEVSDDGAGGADPGRGSGLRGIERRLSAFDGTLTVSSPAGGPTQLAMVLPCASSSPRITPSSGTA